ncbi:MAG TPA: PAS domain-containing protein, partial [Gemmatimonadales bacterium]|jgi:PAS domain-containing protein|nr:PAS domain-containing protein [Gemmatimonadales bacterium]
MRDQHRDKRDLVNEVTDLRKQVADLKQAAAERRRVEDGLRHDRELFRGLLDQAPHPLCLLTSTGFPLLANRAFAELLGYASAGELVRLGGELGLVLGDDALGDGPPSSQSKEITFRRYDGASLTAPVVSAVVPRTELLAITVLTHQQLA